MSALIKNSIYKHKNLKGIVESLLLSHKYITVPNRDVLGNWNKTCIVRLIKGGEFWISYTKTHKECFIRDYFLFCHFYKYDFKYKFGKTPTTLQVLDDYIIEGVHSCNGSIRERFLEKDSLIHLTTSAYNKSWSIVELNVTNL